MMCSQERIAGYEAAMGRAGIPVSRSLIRHGDFYVGGGSKAGAALLGLRDRPTAIFAGSDEQARGVYDEAHARGLRIPQDLSVVGFDDVDVCEWMSPRLTTVRQPLAQMAALAIRTVPQDPPSSGEEPTRIELSTTLVVRDSTAPPGTSTDAKRRVRPVAGLPPVAPGFVGRASEWPILELCQMRVMAAMSSSSSEDSTSGGRLRWSV
jgi:LacI family transcriptional regulator